MSWITPDTFTNDAYIFSTDVKLAEHRHYPLWFLQLQHNSKIAGIWKSIDPRTSTSEQAEKVPDPPSYSAIRQSLHKRDAEEHAQACTEWSQKDESSRGPEPVLEAASPWEIKMEYEYAREAYADERAQRKSAELAILRWYELTVAASFKTSVALKNQHQHGDEDTTLRLILKLLHEMIAPSNMYTLVMTKKGYKVVLKEGRHRDRSAFVGSELHKPSRR